MAESDSDTSSSSSDERVEEAGTHTELVDDGSLDRLEARARASPYDWPLALEYLRACRALADSSGDISRLRQARESLAERFPLTEDLWLEWLGDEERILVNGDDEATAAHERLYRRALGDYLSIELWARYCAFVASTYPDRASAAFEEALSIGGLHVRQGSVLWNALRAWQSAVDDDKEKLLKTYQRQLSVPLMGMDEVLVEFETWAGGAAVDEEAVEAVRTQSAKARKQLAEREAFELELADSGTPNKPNYNKAPRWLEYLAFEEREGSPARTQCLYERAVQNYVVMPEFWLRYLSFAERKLGAAAVLPIYMRASRNCTSSGAVWAGLMRSLERAGKPYDEVEAAMKRSFVFVQETPEALSDVFAAHIDYCRRHFDSSKPESGELLRSACQAAADTFEQSFPNTEYYVAILQHWASLEARVLGATAKGHDLWEQVARRRATDAQFWLDYTTMERATSTADRTRSLYKRAIASVSDGVERIAQAWLQFERETGTLGQWQQAHERCSDKLAIVFERRHREAVQKAAEVPAPAPAPAAQKRKGDDLQGRDQKRAKAEMISQASGERTCRTVHVSNLPFSTKEDEIAQAFAGYGPVVEIRMGRDSSGRFKGFCFIEFQKEESAAASLASNSKPLGGRAMKVERSSLAKASAPRVVAPPNEPKNDSGIMLPPDRTIESESLTLFVTNVDFEATQEEVEKVFSEHGKLKAVRMPRDASGKIKGFAYVEYEDAESFKKALSLMDKYVLHNRGLRVQPSRPPGPGGHAASRRPHVQIKPQQDETAMQVDAGGESKEAEKKDEEPKEKVTFARPRALRH